MIISQLKFPSFGNGMVVPITSSNKGKRNYTQIILPVEHEKNKVFISDYPHYFSNEHILSAIWYTSKKSNSDYKIIFTPNFVYDYGNHKLVSYIENGTQFIIEEYYESMANDICLRKDYIKSKRIVSVKSLDCFLTRKFEFQSRNQKQYVIHQFKEYLKHSA